MLPPPPPPPPPTRPAPAGPSTLPHRALAPSPLPLQQVRPCAGRIWSSYGQIHHRLRPDLVIPCATRWSSCRPRHRRAQAAPRHPRSRMWSGALRPPSRRLHAARTNPVRPPLLQRGVTLVGRGGQLARLPCDPFAPPSQPGRVHSINRRSLGGLACCAGGGIQTPRRCWLAADMTTAPATQRHVERRIHGGLARRSHLLRALSLRQCGHSRSERRGVASSA